MTDYPIYCINLEHRQDRKEHSLKQFAKLGISPDTVIYPHFVKDKRGGVYGCFDSHMKIWKDFYTNYPDAKYVLVFEDDFVVSDKTMDIINNASQFIDDNYDGVDVLLLHNNYIFNYDGNKHNNAQFENGFGLTTTAMFVTRHYIQSILDKYGKFPEPTGRHYDYEMSFNTIDTDVMIYTDKIFYSKKECTTQLIGESDAASNIVDQLFRRDINSQVENWLNMWRFLYPAFLTKKQAFALGYISGRMFTHA